MQGFDPSSFLVITGLLGTLCLVILAAVIRSSFPKSIGGIAEWSWACGFMVAAAFLFSSTTLLPIGMSRLIANILLLVGLLMMYIALRKFAGLAPAFRILAGLLGAVSLLLVWYTLVDSSYRVRVGLAMTVHVTMFLLCARVLLQLKHNGFPERFTLTVFLLLGMVSLARFGAVVAGYDSLSATDSTSPYQARYVAVMTFSIIALTLGFMLMLSRRLRNTLGYLTTNSAFAKDRYDARMELEHDLRWVIARNQLVMHYQPRLCMRTGMVVGLEALLRWNHPTKGLIGPDQFIKTSEATGDILPIGEWALDQAVHTLSRFHAGEWPGMRMSVNVSPKQFSCGALSAQVERILKKAAFEPGQLELELTESVVIGNPVKAETIMMQLKRMGVRLAIDDFGTGYSSLSYLKRLPVDCVKIDRSFVRDLPADPGDVAICRAIIAMSHALGLQVVAEGVEKPEQAAFLSDNGCDEYQGHLFSAAVPEDDLLELLQAQSAEPAGRIPLSSQSPREYRRG